MDYSPAFLKIRAIGLGLISFLSLLAIILFCIQIFVQWDTTASSERYMIILMLLTHTVTVIMLPILILVSFRPWLDAIRFLFLLVVHISTDTTFTYWFPRYACPENATQREQCRLFNIYILVLSWIVTAHVIIYVIGLSVFVYRTQTSAANPSKVNLIDEEAMDSGRDLTPSMSESRPQSSVTTSGPRVSIPSPTLARMSQQEVHRPWSSSTMYPSGARMSTQIIAGTSREVYRPRTSSIHVTAPRRSLPIPEQSSSLRPQSMSVQDVRRPKSIQSSTPRQSLYISGPSPLSSRPPRMPRPSTYGAKSPGPSGVRSSLSPTIATSQSASRVRSVRLS
ncbi:hypothetical protein IW261DRAFT_1463672 [Armillaria novae-zelandiae]|uniref:Uncharacterized protein n=1 Tax=Armillaria novae-zelandiae TaxID=153914 RepID=A0AA39PH69_9AGAR|nr:hypothetical protein IW261DRAFT_1463672 [Armillaria novae-zelandiae]